MTQLKLVLLLALALLAAPQAPGADLILHNGVIWTVDAQNPTAQAVAVKDGKFVAVGADKPVLALRGPKTRVIDLKAASSFPVSTTTTFTLLPRRSFSNSTSCAFRRRKSLSRA